jgi:hypothetical protein
MVRFQKLTRNLFLVNSVYQICLYSYDCLQLHVFTYLKRAHRERNVYLMLNTRNCQTYFVLLM